MEATIERGFLDRSLQTLLHNARLRHDHVAVLLFTLQEIRVRDEARRVLEDQDQPPKLHRLAGLAALVQLRVRLKQAEQLLGVGHLFSLQHAPPGRVAHLLGALQKHADLRQPCHSRPTG